MAVIYRKKRGAVLSALVLLLLESGCGGYGEKNLLNGTALTIASWNVQALFDNVDKGWEYDEYRGGSGWTEEKYTARLNNIAKAAQAIGDKSPDVITFIEIENGEIVEKINKDFLGKEGYKYYFFAGNPGYSLGTAVLSKVKFSKAFAHSVNTEGSVIPRPVSELWLEKDGGWIVIFVCHWKSKLGGGEKTEKLRRDSAKIIVRRQREIRTLSGNIPVLVLGDLNENHDEFYRTGGQYVCALLPDDPEAARKAGYFSSSGGGKTEKVIELPPELEKQDFLILSTKKPPESAFFQSEDGVFYSPWGGELSNGSYFYNGGWETIDHFLLNSAFFDGTGFEFKNCYVLDRPPFVNSNGEPDRYNPRTGQGLSDHLPLLLTIKKLP